ncbi:MAG TPA: ABC transporter permease [Cyclobacteriaceae bacterium]|nr:ABC transporter permease [Cyclobacteriaceae bacterium]
MFKHYVIIIYRNFLRSKGYFLINLAGLAAGLTCTLLIYLWVQDELHMDKFHEKDANLFQVMEHQQYSDRLMTTTSTPGSLSEALKADYPEIEYAMTASWINDHTLSIKDHNIKAKGWDVDPAFFNMFSYKLVEGTPGEVLKDKYSMVISKSLAVRLFDTDRDVVGKTVEVDHGKSFNVTGLMEDVPNDSQYKFDYVISFELMRSEQEWLRSWGSNGPPTFILTKAGTVPADLENKIKDYVKKKNDRSQVTLFLQKYSDRYLYGSYNEEGKQEGGRIWYVKLFSLIAIFILVIACINFMNLSTARATRKSKEVGIKKSVGAGRQSLIWQYMSESIITTILSLLVALMLVYFALIPFNVVTDKQIKLDLGDPALLMWLFGVTIGTGLLAGSYPALYLSGFKPAAVLKGEMKNSLGELWARKGLVVFQFWLSVILIISVIVIYKQIEYVQTLSLGYDKSHMIRIYREGRLEKDIDAFLNEVRRVPGVVNAASIGHGLLGQQNNTSGLQWEGKDPEERILFENIAVDDDVLTTLGVSLVDGHDFTKTPSDSSKVIFNEKGIEAMNLSDPIGKHIKLWDRHDLEIIGVVKNFNFMSMHEEIKPMFFRFNKQNSYNILIRLEPAKEKAAIEKIGELYSKFNPGFSFEYRYQDEEYAKLYSGEQRVAQLASYFATMAVLISCLGLFGLAAFTAERRLKEIGIRKALGSSSTNIVLLLSGDFTKMVLISVVLGLPVGYWFLDTWLNEFAYRVPLNMMYFVSAGLLALLIAWITVASQAIRASRTNPVQCLRME